MRRVLVIDPLGESHAVAFTPTGGVDGAENLVHGEPRELRDALLGELLARIHVTAHGTYRGYRWEDAPA